MLEIEAKIRVDSLTPVRNRLASLDARFVGRYLETNRILDRRDGSLRLGGSGLRVRSIETLEGSPAPATLTFKGPRQGGEFKTRQELECSVDQADTAEAILNAIGFETVVRYQKRRERWMWSHCHVELDEAPLIGTFVEIEGPTEQSIRIVRPQLGLDNATLESRSYVRMLVEQCTAAGLSPVDIVF